jgi:CO dehydrogenase nickel-insertion accessory protein CooC1
MELKGMIQDQTILVISSYDKANDHLFHSKNLAEAFKNQGRKVLIIDATGQLESDFDTPDYFNFSNPKYLSQTKSVFQNEIQGKMKNYNLCVIHNQSINEDKLALLFMSLATQNLIVLDSRKTAEKTIIKIELLKDEFQLPNVWFVLNKAGYNPNIIVEIKNFWNKYINKRNS